MDIPKELAIPTGSNSSSLSGNTFISSSSSFGGTIRSKRRKKKLRTIAIDIDTQSRPFEIPKAIPRVIVQLSDGDIEENNNVNVTKEWNSFCEEIDNALGSLEETIIKLRITHVLFVFFYIAIIITSLCIYFKTTTMMEGKLYICICIGIFVFSFHMYVLCHVIGKEYIARSTDIQQVCIDFSTSSSSDIKYEYQFSSLTRLGWNDLVEAKITVQGRIKN